MCLEKDRVRADELQLSGDEKRQAHFQCVCNNMHKTGKEH